MIRAFLVLLFFFFSSLLVNAQSYGLEGLFHVGKVVKHKEGLNYQDPDASKGIEINLVRESYGYSAWERYWGKPDIEATLLYLDFGNRRELGHAIGIIPGLRFELLKINRFTAKLHFGVGVAYVTKKFDRINNNGNNAIGSHFNNASRLKLMFHGSLSKQIRVFGGFGVNHFSNGLSKSPNSGINAFSCQIGVYAQLSNPVFDDSKLKHYSPKGKRLQWVTQAGLGFSNSVTPDGPNYPVHFYSMGVGIDIGKFQNLILGVEYEHHSGIYHFQKHIFTEESIARNRATRYSFVIANELFMADLGFRFQLGYYLDFPEEKTGDPIYFKLDTNYYPPWIQYRGLRPYLGVLLKSHFAVAEYLGLVVGFRL